MELEKAKSTISTISILWAFLGSACLTIGSVMFFYYNVEADHSWIETKGKPHVELHEQQSQLKDYQWQEIQKTLEEIKSDIKEIKRNK